MSLYSYVICLILLSTQFRLCTAQLSSKETLLTATTCDVEDDVNISCGVDGIIAFESLRYFFDYRCETVCCTYNATDEVVHGSSRDTAIIRRSCSGYSSCNITLQSTHEFGSSGLSHSNSYIVLQYYCIPVTRVMPICTSRTLSSDGLPLYLTSSDYPHSTIGTESCSCSLEVYSCSLDVKLSIVDADLYSEPNYCIQHLDFQDRSNTTLWTISCESYYDSNIETHMLNSHYLTANFHNQNDMIIEGFFFIGFEASDSATHFTISCPSNHETICMDCGSTDTIDHGHITLHVRDVSTFEAMANVLCEAGYHASTDVVTCLEDGTWEPAHCEIKACGSTDTIAHGHITLHAKDISTFEAMANVFCEAGYHASTDVVMCLEDGMWEPAHCEIKDCGSTDTIAHGHITLHAKYISTFEAMANVFCEAGYHASTYVVTCLEDGTWEPAHCEIKDCGSPHKIDHGHITLHVRDISTFEAMANVSCETGYHASTDVVACLEDGMWEPAHCEIQDCGSPHTIDHGHITLHAKDISTFEAMANVFCEAGYHASKDVVACLEDGVWEPAHCEIKDCGSPHTIDHGHITLQVRNISTFEAMADVTCAIGYHASIDVVACLEDGMWEPAHCEIIETDCGSPHSIDHGHITLHVTHISTFGALANVTCVPGYHASTYVVECLEYGMWGKASCEIKDCGSPHTIDHGHIALCIRDKSTFEALAHVSCAAGYNTTTDVVECLADGMWESAACDIKDCGSPHTIDLGHITLQVSNISTFEAMANVTCAVGNHASTDVVACLEDGMWEPAHCEIIDCGSPHTIDHGSIALHVPNTSTFGAMASVTCFACYQTTTATVACLEDSMWEPASCEKKDESKEMWALVGLVSGAGLIVLVMAIVLLVSGKAAAQTTLT